jgi:hypothetical protein
VEFKVGDTVICETYGGHLGQTGTVIRITEKRGDVVVDYGNHQETYRSDGYGRGSVWRTPHIKLLTPDIQEKIRRANLIRECRKKFEDKKDLTAEQAEKILEILKDDDE